MSARESTLKVTSICLLAAVVSLPLTAPFARVLTVGSMRRAAVTLWRRLTTGSTRKAILRATPLAVMNDTGLRRFSSIGSTLRWSVTLTFMALPRIHATALPFHQGIFDAIRRQDAKAAERLMREHIEVATRNTLDSLAAVGLVSS